MAVAGFIVLVLLRLLRFEFLITEGSRKWGRAEAAEENEYE